MKIAIFGDGFGVNSSNLTSSWVDILSMRYVVQNFSISNSSIYYSYLTFLENHTDFDKIIFLSTSPGGLLLNECTTQKHINSYEVADFYLNIANNYNHKDRPILSAAKQYFLYVKNERFDYTIHKLILRELIKVRKDILLIPCSGESCAEERSNNLMKASLLDCNYYKIKYPLKNYNDIRHCHMNKLNNKLLADEIINYLTNGKFNLDECHWQIDYSTPVNLYFEGRK